MPARSRFLPLIFIVFALLPQWVEAAAGKFILVLGPVQVQQANGKTVFAHQGQEIDQGDLVLTDAGRAQLRFTDGALISLQPQTQFQVDQYRYDGQPDGNETGFFSLLKGGLRTITGLIGKSKRSAYHLKTPSATIGIRGTEYLADQTDHLHVTVTLGQIDVFNDAGSILVDTGESASVGGPDEKPVLTNDPVNFGKTPSSPKNTPVLGSIVDPIGDTPPAVTDDLHGGNRNAPPITGDNNLGNRSFVAPNGK